MTNIQDPKLLEKEEQELRDAGNEELALLVRLARRYLALRKNCGVFMLYDGTACNKSNLDAAADRLLEDGK